MRKDSFPKWLALALALAMAAVWSTGLWFHHTQSKRLRADTEDDLRVVARSKAREIAAWRAERLADAGVLTESPLAADAVSRWMASRQEEDEAPVRAHFRAMKDRLGYAEVLVVDPTVSVLLNLGSENATPYPELIARVRTALDQRQPLLTDLHTDALELSPHIGIVAPLFAHGNRAAGEPVGAAFLRCNANDFLSPLIESWPTSSETAETLLVQKEGDSVVVLKKLDRGTGSALTRHPLDGADVLIAKAALTTQSLVIPATDYRGESVLAAIQPIPLGPSQSPWILVAKVDTAEVLAPERRLAVLVLSTTLLLALTAAAGAGLIWQRHQKGYFQALADAQAAQSESEAKYVDLYENSPDMHFTLDTASGRILGCNETMARATGYRKDEIVGRSVFDFYRPDFRDAARSALAEFMESGEMRDAERQVMRKDGSVFQVSLSATAVRDASDRILHSRTVWRDITVRKKALDDLARERGLLRTLIDHLPGSVYVKDTESRFLVANRSVASRLRVDSPEDLLGKSDADFLPGDLAAMLRAEEETVLRTGAPLVDKDEEGRDANGDLRAFLTSKVPFRDANGDIVGLVGISHDITERKRAEEALHRRSAVDAALADLSTEMLKSDETIEQVYPVVLRHARALTASAHGFVASIDPKTGAMTGHSLTEMMGQDCNLALPATCLRFERGADGRYSGLWGHSLNTREPFFTNTPGAHPAAAGVPDGHVPLHRFLSVPVIVEDELLGQIALANAPRDYTQEDVEPVRRLAELYGMFLRERLTKAHLRESEEQLRQSQKMEAVGRLAGGVAHDFNNMLQTILGYSDVLLRGAAPGSDLAECLHEIHQAARRSADLTRQLLAFARKETIAPKSTDLNDKVGAMLKMLRRLIGENIELVWRPAAHLGTVLVDPAQLDQMLANLVVNSRDAIAGVGRITIETHNVELDDAFGADHLDATPGPYVMLAVSDTGCGMDRQALANIFEPFFTTKETGKGTGLGLATVYGAVKQNNGFISVYSEPGLGTTFRIYLPRIEPEDAEGATPEAVEPSGGPETILLVEDEDTLLRLGKRLLDRLGYTVLAADTPPKAIQVAQEHAGPIHLLVTDVVMPEMSGRALWQRLSALLPGLKCLYMSGYTADIIAHHGVLEKGVHFLSKPFSAADLAAKVREALDKE